MSKKTPVPKLDLAPKLKRPLSLWNPLDYLLLLYWVFFFPQALRWYVDTFGGSYIAESEMNWRKGLEIIRQNPVQRQLLFQGVFLTVITPLLICRILEQLDVYVDWLGVALGVALGVTLSVAGGVSFGLAISVAGGLAISVALEVAGGVALSVVVGVSFGLALELAGGVGFGVAVGVALGVVFGGVGGVGFGVGLGVGFGVAIMRPENWLLGSFKYLQPRQNNWFLSRITYLPLPHLNFRLRNWLRQNWETSLHNINQLLEYTLQFISTINAVNQVLVKIPDEHLIFRVSQLANNPFDWDLVYYTSASLNDALKSEFIDNLFIIPNPWKRNLQNRFNTNPRIDTYPRATGAGFWYLHEKKANKAKEAFLVVRSLPYGEEMYTLAQTLALCQTAKNRQQIITIQLPQFPPKPYLRPTTWEAINSFKRVIEDTKVTQQGSSRTARSFALNRAIGELRSIIDQQKNLPEAERKLIVDIAKNWKDSLEKITKEIGNIAITKPISNPYVIGNPVFNKNFVGREEIMRQLEELWVMGKNLQSVVIFGHRRMGKTSILRNFNSGSHAQLVYINLQELGDIQEGLGEVFLTICDEISDATKVNPPDEDKIIQFPERSFKKYLKQVIANFGDKGLIIALDEFETIEELIETGKISPNLMGYLRVLVQMSPQIAFAFAGLHTLEEMTANYFEPFFASVIPIRVGFLNAAATRQILANPSDDFLLDYTPEALEHIYELTSGQPYLVQLVGFQLVRRYNDYVFEQGQTRDPVFTLEDVEIVISDRTFFQNGRYYFEGVWKQAAEGAPGQQEIIKLIAPYPEGLSRQELVNAVSEEVNLDNALETLKRHDVVTETDTGIKIIVELFRRWADENIT